MWFCGSGNTCCLEIHPVRTLFSNGFLLYDIQGNVSEWVQDLYHADYIGAPTDGNAWETDGTSERVLRGGNWGTTARNCRSAARGSGDPMTADDKVGFRIVWMP